VENKLSGSEEKKVLQVKGLASRNVEQSKGGKRCRKLTRGGWAANTSRGGFSKGAYENTGELKESAGVEVLKKTYQVPA